MKPINLRNYIIAAVLIIPLIVLVFWIISTLNREVELRNMFNAKISERTAFYDKMWKTLSQKSSIALRNDSSFREIVNIQVTGQKDGDQIMWKWVQQSNPAATYTEVSALYKDISRAVESERESFFDQEKVLQDVKLQHDNLRKKFPGSIVLNGKGELPYKPITSDRTDDVIRTGKDNNVELFK